VEVTLDGDGRDPSRACYTFEMKHNAGLLLWRMRIRFRSKTLAEDNEYAAKKVVQKLVSDWKKSAKKAPPHYEPS
jgi:hypothetical protein